MSYQVLARKWRPKTFREMVGQAHVLKALINALDHDRLHHAYLFTGTRGVGKTTIARVLAKCLNCEVGVSSEPCNQCAACTEINEGRFIDLIEVDAASRTKVEDTRELLDNVQYTPTRGRYKVYLIDEVHMLSNSSFNALLKTLEEPPPHVKFLLATTDPQKLPATILSRCLQFSLKSISAERIVDYLQQILQQERVPFEEAGLWQLGRAAEGSMRDALSLTDQGIAYGGGKISDADMRAMLGSLDQTLVFGILQALVEEDSRGILAAVGKLAEYTPDYRAALAEIINVLHRIAIAQALPEAIDNSLGDRQQIYDLAQAMAAEDVQLYYQTALLGRRDLPLVPDARAGFEMILLRMLAFKPQGLADLPKKSLLVPEKDVSQAEATVFETSVSEAPATPEAAGVQGDTVVSAIAGEAVATPEKKSETAAAAAVALLSATRSASATATAQTSEEMAVAETMVASTTARAKKIPLAELLPEHWPGIYQTLTIDGLLRSTAANCALVSQQGKQLAFILDARQSALYDDSHQQRLAEVLGDYFQTPVEVAITLGQPVVETPAQAALRLLQQRQQAAERAIASDPVVQQLQKTFGAQIVEGSIKSIDV